jgi:hypothetical protein
VVLQQDEAALARIAQAAQPKGTPQLGEVHPVRRPLLSADQNYTPAALSPLRRQNPREEPGALAAHAGICAGGEEKSSSLPRPSDCTAVGVLARLTNCPEGGVRPGRDCDQMGREDGPFSGSSGIKLPIRAGILSLHGVVFDIFVFDPAAGAAPIPGCRAATTAAPPIRVRPAHCRSQNPPW